MRMKKLAGWLALAVLGGCNPMVDDSELEPDEPVAALVGELRTNSQADLDFSESGRGRLFAPTEAMWLSAVADGGGGKVAFASGAWMASLSRYDGIVGRVTTSGTRDTTWHGDADGPGSDRVLNDDLVADDVNPVALQVIGGKTYVAGWMTVGAGRRSFLVKLDEHGERVTGFSGDGILKPAPLGYESFIISRLFVDKAGRLVVVGSTSKMVDGTRKYYAAVARFKPDNGAWDETYGGDGWAMRETGTTMVVAGMAANQDEVVIASNNKVFRFDAKGDYDRDFGTRKYTSVIDVAVASNGHVYLLSNVGGSETGEPRWASSYHRLIALNADGTKDDDFAFHPTPDHGPNGGPAGPADPDFFDEPGRADLTCEGGFAAQRLEYNERLGRIYVLGNVTRADDSTKKYWGTLAFLPTGDYDPSFGEAGRLYTDFVKLDAEVAYDMALQTFTNAAGPQERILMSGQGTPEHKGPLARVIIDWGHAGEPCRSNACDPGFVCKTEGTAIKKKVCRAD